MAVLALEDAIADTPDISAAGGSPSKAAGPDAADSTPAESKEHLLQAQGGRGPLQSALAVSLKSRCFV